MWRHAWCLTSHSNLTVHYISSYEAEKSALFLWVKKERNYSKSLEVGNEYPYNVDVGKKTGKLPERMIV